MQIYRDSSGLALADYPRPSVAVDTALLTVIGDELHVLVVADERGSLRLPGTFLHEGEVLADAVRRSLADKAGVAGVSPQQLGVFDAPDRDARGWVLSVAHMAAVPDSVLVASLPGGVTTRPVIGIGQALDFDHDAIVDRAVSRLREEYASAPDPRGLLGDEPFTLLRLERLHRAVDPETPLRDTFRRSMEPLLSPAGGHERGVVGKPARLFTQARRGVSEPDGTLPR